MLFFVILTEFLEFSRFLPTAIVIWSFNDIILLIELKKLLKNFYMESSQRDLWKKSVLLALAVQNTVN